MKKLELTRWIVLIGFVFLAGKELNAQWIYNTAPNVYTTQYGASTRVGIGLSSPQETLHINGSLRGNQSGAVRISSGYGVVDIGAKNASFAHFTTDRSRYYFDKEIMVNTGYIGSYSGDLSLRTAGTTWMTINSSGNVGIGTASPTSKLHVEGTTRLNGAVGIGTIVPTGSQLAIKTGWGDWIKFESSINTGHWSIHNNAGQQDFQIYYTKPDGSRIWPFALRNDGIIQFEGKVGINTSNTQGYALAVNGKIWCEELQVVTDVPAADYVFEEDYNLLSLEEVESFITENKHLPEVPSAAEFKENGYSVGTMDEILLKKVEELTLYIIAQQKLIEQQNERLKQLESVK